MLPLSTSNQPPRLPVGTLQPTTTLPADTNGTLFSTNSANAGFSFLADPIANLSEADRKLFVEFGQGPAQTLPYEAIHHPFEVQAANIPNAIAAEHQGETITYQELNRQANRLAMILTEHGVTTGDNVALFLQRSIPMLVGIMGSLKAGAAYVPQHVGVAPEAQLRHILEATEAKVILTISSLRDQVPVPDGCVCIAVDELMAEPFDAGSNSSGIDCDALFTPATSIDPDNCCFILFTSGTTGNPNGVQVTHRNVCNILLTEPGNLGMKPGMKVAQILSIAFDMAAWETLTCLAHGATLLIRGKDFTATASRADVIISTPSILSTIDADRCHGVQTVAVAGEPCPRALADKWGAFCNFYNSCGPTETTIVNTMQLHDLHAERLTIGAPTPNNTVYVLDKDRQPVAIGEIGDMWAGGDCVSAGYLKNEALTSERYAPDPFLAGEHVMFNTRDLGRWTEDGQLEHFGRSDDQVKVRGFRVELDSVSAALESVPHCKRAAALKFDSRNLVAFVSPKVVDVAAAKQAVADALPYYCTPAFVLALDELPMTSRGKIDKRLLMDLAVAHEEKTHCVEQADSTHKSKDSFSNMTVSNTTVSNTATSVKEAATADVAQTDLVGAA